MKNRSYKEFTDLELSSGYIYMYKQIKKAPENYRDKIKEVFEYYWRRFLEGKFKVDGATFIDEEDENFFNVWWFIHDGRNAEGYVGSLVDKEMLSVMILVDVPPKYFMQAVPLFYLTFINKIKHIVFGNYKRDTPNNLITIV